MGCESNMEDMSAGGFPHIVLQPPKMSSKPGSFSAAAYIADGTR